jgi:hypothetical protein
MLWRFLFLPHVTIQSTTLRLDPCTLQETSSFVPLYGTRNNNKVRQPPHFTPTPTSESNGRGSSCRIGRRRFASFVVIAFGAVALRRGSGLFRFETDSSSRSFRASLDDGVGHRRTTFKGFETTVDQSALGRQCGDSIAWVLHRAILNNPVDMHQTRFSMDRLVRGNVVTLLLLRFRRPLRHRERRHRCTSLRGKLLRTTTTRRPCARAVTFHSPSMNIFSHMTSSFTPLFRGV